MVNEIVALFIPLLLAVVTGLSSFLRESVDLETAVIRDRPSFPVLLSFLPPLGRFPAIHLSNILLLLIGIRLIKDVATDNQTAIIGAVVLGLFLLILPMIEIDLFDQILDEGGSQWFSPRSYYYHCLGVIFLSLSFFGFVELQVMVINFFVLRGFSVSGTAIWLLNRILGIILIPSLVIGAIFICWSLVCLRAEIQQISRKN
ncbi:hypothetical protein [Haloarcula amylovorans]|uniref:hypothetical protein n=1 Tax=Haloarcula amylovorans TaxID=2562280 RepID=UPI0010761D9F|nr:hypothetical protein [Halomicroarcula amylolytica]